MHQIIHKRKSQLVKNKQVKYKFAENNNDKIIIIFQNVNCTLQDIELSFKNEEFRKSFLEKETEPVYSYYKFIEEFNSEYDILFIEDDNSFIYGYYILDKGVEVYESYIEFIDIFCSNKYEKENVYSFGSSKGGFASLFFGINCSCIGNAIALVPQIDIVNYMKVPWQKKVFYEYMLLDSNLNVKDMLFKDFPSNEKNIIIFTGIGDSDIEGVIKFKNFTENKNYDVKYIISKDKSLNHSDLCKFYLPHAKKFFQ